MSHLLTHHCAGMQGWTATYHVGCCVRTFLLLVI